MFEAFKLEMIELRGAMLRVRHGGSGPPVLLLHGHPRTHATWHRVVPEELARAIGSFIPAAADSYRRGECDGQSCPTWTE